MTVDHGRDRSPTLLERLRGEAIPITWTTLLIGYRGIGPADAGSLKSRRLASAAEDTDVQTELRKWRVTLLAERLAQLPVEPLEGYLELMDLWSNLDWPPDAPPVVRNLDKQRFDDALTTEGFAVFVQARQDWMQRELDELRRRG